MAVYRNQDTLRGTWQELKALFDDGGPLSAYRYELVFVDDGSDDGSFEELTALQAADPAVRVVSFSRNFGQNAAVVAGFRHASGDAVVNKGADQQEPLDAVVQMVREWEQGTEVVLGRRIGREDSLLARVLGNSYWAILKWLNPNMPVGSDFFLIGRKAVAVFNTIEESDRFFPVDVLWLGFRPCIVDYKRRRRLAGKSQWSLSRKTKAGVDGILHSSYLPIRLISFFGICVAGLGFGAAGVVVVLSFTIPHRYPGWLSIVCLLLLLHGLTLLMLGIIGEYVWRIYNQSKRRAEYVIWRKLGF